MAWKPADELPIPLRPDLTIFVQGIPWDFTLDEAKRVAALIEAMAVDATPPEPLAASVERGHGKMERVR